MLSYLLVAAVASGQLSFADGTITWYEPADGVPLSGLESSQACESRGQRLCLYDELCPSGENSQPVGMPSSHSDWMPFISTTYGRRWMTGGCQVHEDLYDEGCDVPGCGPSEAGALEESRLDDGRRFDAVISEGYSVEDQRPALPPA